jgi:hypothetical protein
MSKTSYALAAILVAALLCGPNLSRAQQSGAQEDEVFWINLPSSPLRLGLDRNRRFLEVRNHSSGVVTGYQLGCATEEAGKIKVHRNFESGEIKNGLQPGWFTVSDFKYRDLCSEKKAKLVVVLVSFADGSQWMIKQ